MTNQSIINLLEKQKGYISGQLISSQLKISRAAIWKHIQDLRRRGYHIDAITNRGYQLVKSPDTLSAATIKRYVKTKRIGREIVCLDQVASTMDEAFRLAQQGISDGAIVCAEHQSKGRGRLGRQWESPKATGLYFSIILRPSLSVSQLPQLTLMTAIAIRRAIHECYGIDALIKWPNDLLINNKKVAGILTETRLEADQVRLVVIGIGINVNAIPKSVGKIATSLKAQLKKDIDRNQLLGVIINKMEQCYTLVLNDRFSQLLKEIKQYSATLKNKVKVSIGKQTIEGIADNLDSDGALVIRMADNRLQRLMAGDVEHVR